MSGPTSEGISATLWCWYAVCGSVWMSGLCSCHDSAHFIICSILHLSEEGTGLNAECAEHLVSGICILFLHTLHSFNILSSVLIIRTAGQRGVWVRVEMMQQAHLSYRLKEANRGQERWRHQGMNSAVAKRSCHFYWLQCIVCIQSEDHTGF